MIRFTLNVLFLSTLAMANPLTLDYKPIKPFYFNPAPYPQPFARPDNPDGTYNKKPTTENTVDTTVDLRFKSTTPTTTTTTTNTFVPYPPNSIRPPFYPDGRPYPEPIIPAGNTGSSNEDRFKPTTITYTTPRPPQNSVNTLEYVPIRPPFYPDGRPYPEPIIPPATQQPTYQPTIILLSTTPSELNINGIGPIQVIPALIPDDESIIDTVIKSTETIPNRFGETSTSKPISLEYIPMRPPFYPNGQPYPQPNPGNPKPTRDTTAKPDSYQPSPSPVIQITGSVGFVPVSTTYSTGTMKTTKPAEVTDRTDRIDTEVRLADEPFTTQPLGENTPFTSRTNPKYTDKLKPTSTLPTFTNKPLESVGNRVGTSQRPKTTTKWDYDTIIFPDD